MSVRARNRSGAPTEAVLALVDGCRRRAVFAHRTRAACGALGAAVVVLALVVAEGRSLLDAHALALAALVGLCAFVGWERSKRYTAAGAAHAIERTSAGAGLLAAFESARRGESTPVRELAALRAYRAVPRRRAVGATVPVAAPWVAFPLAALAALLFAVELRDSRASAEDGAAAAFAGLAGHLDARAGELASALAPEERAALDALVGAARAALEEAGESGGAIDAESARGVADELERLASEVGDEGAAAALRELALEAELAAPRAAPAEVAPADAPRAEPPSDAALPPDSTAAETRGAANGAQEGATAGDGPRSGDAASASGGPEALFAGDAADAPAEPVEGAAAVDGDERGEPSSGTRGAAGPPPSSDVPTSDDAAPPAGAEPPARAAPPPKAPPARHRALIRAWLASQSSAD